MSFDDYKVVLYRQDDGSWVAEIPALGGCYALMQTREAALAELEQVFALIAQEYQDRGQPLPKDTTEIVHAYTARISRPRAVLDGRDLVRKLLRWQPTAATATRCLAA
jgi:predicted RNase H-like HicB family nuclease